MQISDLISDRTPEHSKLNSLVAENLKGRLSSHSSYSAQEIADIAELDPSLFPDGFELDTEATKDFRLLCGLSKTGLRLPHQISSHRKFIGPLIVFLKRISMPLVSFYMKETLQGIQDFQVSSVVVLAKQHRTTAK